MADQLKAIGHSPDTINYLALSHLHPDHVGNVDLFPDATVLIQRDEYDAAFRRSPCCGFDLRTYKSIRSNRVENLRGDHDVFGDGDVVIKRFPGHTPGSQSLLVRLPGTGPLLISGDLAHSRHNWRRRVVPSLNWNAAQTRASMRRASALLADEGAVLWVQHDLEQYDELRHAPAYYA